MKLALCGYGRMGQEIEQVVRDMGKHEIVTIQCRHRGQVLDRQALKDADAVIDFTAAAAIPDHMRAYCELGLNAVIGATGWDMNDTELRQEVEAAEIGVVVGSNFSAGAHVFLRLVAETARQFSRLDGYDVYGFEIHHAGKQDSPSGTAKTIARTILDNFPAKTTTLFDRAEGPVQPHELHFASVRGGHSPGLHEVIFDSAADEVQLTHQARGRRGFAEGALLAAEYIHGKTGYRFFEELFQPGGPYAA
jgi:4-hydroxy-tetrahydrodipicolinate reductase